MQMHDTAPRSTTRDHDTVAPPAKKTPGDLQENAAVIATVWLIFYLVILGALTIADHTGVAVRPGAIEIAGAR